MRRAVVILAFAVACVEAWAHAPRVDRPGATYPAGASVFLERLGQQMLVNCAVDDAAVAARCRRMLEARMAPCAAARAPQFVDAAAQRAESVAYVRCLMPVPICHGVEVRDPERVVEQCVATAHGQAPDSIAPIPARLRYDAATRTLHVAGWIDKAFGPRLQARLASAPRVRTVLINSGGGYSQQADVGARLLNARGIAVRVDGACASACVSLWAGANARQLGPSAQIGLHDGSVSSSVPRVLHPFVHAVGRWRTAAALRHAGFGEALIARGQATPNGDVLWLGRGALRAAGVRFQPVD